MTAALIAALEQGKNVMSNHKLFASALSALSALTATAALGAGTASASAPPIVTNPGYLQLRAGDAASVSTTIADREFGIGYAASFGIEGYNWNVAANLISVSCVSYLVDIGLVTITVQESECATLPGPKLLSTTLQQSTTYGGYPAVKQTTVHRYDVPDTGTLARIDGFFRIPVTLFDQDYDLFKLAAEAVGDTNAADLVSAEVFVMGQKVAGGSAVLPANKRIAEKCSQLAAVDTSFTLLGIPVAIDGAVTGCLQVDAQAGFAHARLSGTLTPGANVDATFSAGIGGGFEPWLSAEAGVYGDMTVVDARLPISLSLTVGAAGISLSESAKLTMKGLDGEVGVFAEGCLLGSCEEAQRTLFDWTGMTFVDATIFSASQSVAF